MTLCVEAIIQVWYELHVHTWPNCNDGYNILYFHFFQIQHIKFYELVTLLNTFNG